MYLILCVRLYVVLIYFASFLFLYPPPPSSMIFPLCVLFSTLFRSSSSSSAVPVRAHGSSTGAPLLRRRLHLAVGKLGSGPGGPAERGSARVRGALRGRRRVRLTADAASGAGRGTGAPHGPAALESVPRDGGGDHGSGRRTRERGCRMQNR